MMEQCFITAVMFKRAATLFALLLFAAAATASAAPASETPVVQVFKQWLDAFNSGDSARIAAFWKKYGRHGGDDRVEGDLRLRNMTGGMTIYRVEQDAGTHLVALMKENRAPGPNPRWIWHQQIRPLLLA